MDDITPEEVGRALRRAYSLGQTHWQQADSESWKQNRKAAETQDNFNALVSATIDLVIALRARVAGLEADAGRLQQEKSQVWSCPLCGMVPIEFGTDE